MALLLRSQGRTEIARSIYRDIYSENDYYYFYVARTLNWLDEEDPEAPIDSGSYSNTAHRNTMFVKRVQASDVAIMIERRNWTLGTVYDSYDDAYGELDTNGDLITAHSGVTNLADANFYVLTDELNVYKCIYNGGDAPSTVKPSGTDTNIFETSDGYLWKFMFRVEASDASKFLTSTHIPVRKMAGLGEPDFDVNGQIDYITITSPGSGYDQAPFVVIQGDGKTAPDVVIDSSTGAGAKAFAICGVNEETNAFEVSDIVVTTGGSGYKSAVTKTFNGSSSANVSLTGNTITIENHGFETGEIVTYTNGGGTSIGGLTNNRPYYIISVDQNTISLAVSETNANEEIPVDLTSYGTGSNHTLAFAGTTVYLLGGGGSGATATPTIVDGTITSIQVTNGGSGYKGARATCQITDGAVSSVTVVEPGSGFTFANVLFVPRDGDPTETATASAVLGFVEGGVPQENVEAAAVPGTIDRIEVLNGGADYVEGDAVVTITGDGQDAEAIVSLADGAVTGVIITNPGAGYTFADVTIKNINEDSPGAGATFRAILSPYGGHGSNSQKELFAKTLSLTVSLTNESSDTFLNNDFRQIGILINPRKYNSSDIFTSDTGNCCYVAGINNPDLFDYDDVIETDDGGRFIVVQKEDKNLDGTVDAIHLLPIIPLIGEGSVMTNVTKDVAGMEVLNLTPPEVNNKSGEIMYIDNRIKIIRTADQVEKVRALINF